MLRLPLLLSLLPLVPCHSASLAARLPLSAPPPPPPADAPSCCQPASLAHILDSLLGAPPVTLATRS